MRVDADFSATLFNSDESRAGAKISNAEHRKSYAKPIVTELSANMARVDSDFSAKPKAALVVDILAAINEP